MHNSLKCHTRKLKFIRPDSIHRQAKDQTSTLVLQSVESRVRAAGGTKFIETYRYLAELLAPFEIIRLLDTRQQMVGIVSGADPKQALWCADK
jgi:hypothetical protein